MGRWAAGRPRRSRSRWTRPGSPEHSRRPRSGNRRMIEVVTVDALSTIALLVAIEALYPAMRIIHVFLDNARYHHARAVQDWLALPVGGSGSTSCRPTARI